MAKRPMLQLRTPVGNLTWIFITGKGKKNLKDEDIFSGNVEFHKDDPLLKDFEEKIKAFWKENRPSGIKKAKSLGIRKVMEKQLDKDGNEVLDDDDANIMVETDMRAVTFWTGPFYPDGTPKVIKIANAKGNEVSLGKKKIGNGSRGCLVGAAGIYESGKEAGVTLYLNAIQLTKFVEYTGGDNFTDVSAGEADAFTGIEDDGMENVEEEEAKTASDAPKPRL